MVEELFLSRGGGRGRGGERVLSRLRLSAEPYAGLNFVTLRS